MMDRKDRAGERDTCDCTAGYKHGLEKKSANVTYEGYLGVDLSGITRLADGKPANKEDGEGSEPAEACCEREDLKSVRALDISAEHSWPESGHCWVLWKRARAFPM